ncbi:uncharacterized protein LOC143893687 isoform X3 [Temnothorax americanus]|uniref:uncharacterized protein LOC143893687 isoform X3 n=1 Tax=Temnothorax americanus TaxID=1964332 RepID=UPI00406964C5
MSDIYLQAYVFMRQHIPHLSSFDENANDKVLKLDTEATLLFEMKSFGNFTRVHLRRKIFHPEISG